MTKVSLRLTMFGAVCSATLGARAGHAQVEQRLRVTGTVFDSLAHRPLAGARVEIARIVNGGIGVAKAADTDSIGRFDFSDVSAGRHVIVFRHAVLDSLGLESREQVVALDSASGPIRLATPSALTVMRALCPSLASADSTDSTSMLTGHLHDGTNDGPVAEGVVSAMWQQPRIEGKRLSWQEQAVTARTSSAGWFAVCAVPGNSAVRVQGVHDGDSTGVVDVHLSPRAIRHVSLYLSSRAAGRVGRIVGHVRDAQNQPVPKVNVILPGQERTATTDASGAFRLDSVPDGTQSLELRAIGYAPVDTVVRVSYENPLNIDVIVSRATVLAPVVSNASATARSLAIFDMHRKSSTGGGYFIRPVRVEGYESQQTVRTLIQGLPGIPSKIESWRLIIFVDGVQSTMPLAEIDALTDPDEIVGVEVYTRQVPTDYLVKGSRGPVLAIWTKRGPRWSQAGRP